MNTTLKIATIKKYFAITLFLLAAFVLPSCKDDKISAAPKVSVIVNNADITANPSITVASGERVEYQFDITAYSVITNIKTVITDLRKPDQKTSKEIIVGGQSNGLNQSVKSVIFPLYSQEIMVVVKDKDGNEATRSFTITVQ